MSGECDVCGQYGHVEIEHCAFNDGFCGFMDNGNCEILSDLAALVRYHKLRLEIDVASECYSHKSYKAVKDELDAAYAALSDRVKAMLNEEGE
jgi:hypothetical protein